MRLYFWTMFMRDNSGVAARFECQARNAGMAKRVRAYHGAQGYKMNRLRSRPV